MLDELALPEKTLKAVVKKSNTLFDDKLKSHKQLLKLRKADYEEIQVKIKSVEEKWINNQMSHETYTRWHTDLSKQRHALKIQIDTLGQTGDKTSKLFAKELEDLSNLKEIYHKATTIQKHELVRTVFDNRLYYKAGAIEHHTYSIFSRTTT